MILACATLGLIFAGGLVTSTHSGLAVPDWPLSYGRLMPPMTGGILFEHGHRMIAAAVGLLTFAVAFLFARGEPRRWVRRAAWAAAGLVVLQGAFGGLTVLLRLPKPVSILHACLAQTFFCLTVALAVWTSPAWAAGPSEEDPASRVVPLPVISALLFAALYVQLILGALLRHTGRGFAFHAATAGTVLVLSVWAFRRLRRGPMEGGARIVGAALLAGVLIQAALGLGTYALLSGWATAASPAVAAALATSHVAVGAALLGLSVILALLTARRRAARGPDSTNRLSDYFALTKPGISLMTAATALAGYMLGSRGGVDGVKLLHTVLGTLLTSAGACTLNMLMEIDVDARMRRTERRPLPARRLRPGEALFFGSLLSIAGVLYLAWTVNLLTAFLAGVTLSVYLYLYTPLKKITALCTAVGAVAGALPPVMGWTAAAGRLDPGAWSLFGILFFWQFPHFLALAWLYREDYRRAGLYMLPVLEPDGESTARKIVLNSFALLGASLLPVLLGLAGNFYLAAAVALGAGLTLMGGLFFADHSTSSARRLFLASVLYLPILVTLLVLDRLPPS